VIGHPLSHTYSPQIHNYLFGKYGINAVYLAFPTDPAEFKAIVRGLKSLNTRGFNITVPYKSAILRHCDTADPLVNAIGAANTIKAENGKWIAFVTDPFGFRESISLEFKGFSFPRKRILLLGAGGSAVSVAYASLSGRCRELVIMNRTASRAKRLAKKMRSLGFPNCQHVPWDPDFLSHDNGFDLIINSTSAGLRKDDKPHFHLAHAHRETRIYDLIYNPPATPLLREARKRGLPHANGLSMLVFQAFKSFEIWTGIKPSGKDAAFLLQNLGAKPD
jgi:shikimate dehydrogenase